MRQITNPQTEDRIGWFFFITANYFLENFHWQIRSRKLWILCHATQLFQLRITLPANHPTNSVDSNLIIFFLNVRNRGLKPASWIFVFCIFFLFSSCMQIFDAILNSHTQWGASNVHHILKSNKCVNDSWLWCVFALLRLRNTEFEFVCEGSSSHSASVK